MQLSALIKKVTNAAQHAIAAIVRLYDNRKMRTVLHLLAAVIFGVVLLLVLPAAIPGGEGDGGNIIDNIFTSADASDLNVLIIYPEREEWGENEAKYLGARLSRDYSLTPTTISDKAYQKTDADSLEILTASPCLTISLGITDTHEKSYLENYYRLGPSGLEVTLKTTALPDEKPLLDGFLNFDIFNNEEVKNTVDTSRNSIELSILSTSRLRVREGVERFLDHFYTNGKRFRIKQDVVFSHIPDGQKTVPLQTLVTENGNISLLTFSHVDGNEYTLRAMRGMIEATSPDLIVFNGDLVGGCTTRAQLTKIWRDISALLTEYSLPYCFTTGDDFGISLNRDTVCEVISSFDGCLNPSDGNGSTAFTLTVTDRSSIPSALIVIADTFGDNTAFCDLIESQTALISRATGSDIAAVAVLPAATTQISAKLGDIPESYISESLTDLYDSLTYIGADALICAASPTDVRISDNIHLCGSIGFESEGLGGRFDYHNGKRGALSIKLECRRSGYTDTSVSYIFAAELGLAER